MGAVEKQPDTSPAGLETGRNISVHVGRVLRVGVRMVYALPRHRLRRFVAELAAQVGIAQEQEQIAEVIDSAAHQVRKCSFQFRHRDGARGNQVFIPFLMTRAGNQRYAPFVAQADQRIEGIGHGPFPTQQAQEHHASPSSRVQEILARFLGVQPHGMVSLHLRSALRHAGQGTVSGEDVGIGGGYENHRFRADVSLCGQDISAF